MNKTILAILLLFTTSMASATITLAPNETYNFTYNQTNTTDNTTITLTQLQDFYCSLPNSTNACMTNATLSLALIPGETLVTTNNTCSVTASCAQGNTAQTCTVDTALSHGQHYENTGGTCNLSITCPAENCEQNLTTEILTNNITITSNGQLITFNFNGQLQQFPITNGSFSNYFQQTYSCPVYTGTGNASAPADLTGQNLYEYCKTAEPYLLGWVDQQMQQNTKNQDSYNACVIKETQAENGCQARVDSATTETLHCQDQLNSTNNNLQTCYEQKASAESTNSLATLALILGGIYAALATIGAAIGWWMYIRQRRKTREVDE